MKKFYSLFLFVTLTGAAQALDVDTTVVVTQNRFNYKQLIIPTVLIGYGFIGLDNDQIQLWNVKIRDQVVTNTRRQYTVDNFSLFAPPATVYVLNAAGIQGKNNFKDRTIILVGSYLIMGSTVMALKSSTDVMRPDNTTSDSFPSGHTASAFAGAEFLWQEYKDISIWYGIAGYAVATGTGFLRMYNNRHWLTDVAAGAGIGILCTKAAYLLYPLVTGKGSTSSSNTTSFVTPFTNGQQWGITVVMTF
jgi:hypothetical protein